MSAGTPSAVLLASGGLDSTTLAYWLRDKGTNFVPLFLNYGQHCAKMERERLAEVLPSKLFAPIVELNISDIYHNSSSRLINAADLWTERITDDDLYLPYRNLLVLAVGAAYAQSLGASEVYAAFINSNHAKEIDCSAEFFDRLGGMLSDYGSVKVKMPFRDFPKRQVAEIGLALGAPISLTFSCQASSAVPCGVCPNCLDRLEALDGLG